MTDPTLKIDLRTPVISAEEMISMRSPGGRFMTAWIDERGLLNMWTSQNLTYADKLLIMDTIRQHIDQLMRDY